MAIKILNIAPKPMCWSPNLPKIRPLHSVGGLILGRFVGRGKIGDFDGHILVQQTQIDYLDKLV